MIYTGPTDSPLPPPPVVAKLPGEGGMAPFPDGFKRTITGAKVAGFTADGCPIQLHAGVLRIHPLYGVYLIKMYLAQYDSKKDSIYLESAKRVAQASFARMQTPPGWTGEPDGCKAFYYDTIKTGPTWYSAITQGQYLRTFHHLYKSSGDEQYRRIAEAVFESLRLGRESGGVCWYDGDDVVFLEYPARAACHRHSFSTAGRR